MEFIKSENIIDFYERREKQMLNHMETTLRKVIRFLLLFGFCRMPNSADIFTAENILKNSDKFKSQKIQQKIEPDSAKKNSASIFEINLLYYKI